jgi:hypothetical protein
VEVETMGYAHDGRDTTGSGRIVVADPHQEIRAVAVETVSRTYRLPRDLYARIQARLERESSGLRPGATLTETAIVVELLEAGLEALEPKAGKPPRRR